MEELFAYFFEFFGSPLYSDDLVDHLRGYGIECDGNYNGTHWYFTVGWAMIGITGFFYALQYHIIDSVKFYKRIHWWLNALVIVVLNFSLAFGGIYNEVSSENFCNELVISTSDCINFGMSVGLWSLIIFMLLTSFPFPRIFSTNCNHTTFWKP